MPKGPPSYSPLISVFLAEQYWRKSDNDKNGKYDYWTYDVFCLRAIPMYLDPDDMCMDSSIMYSDDCPADKKAFESFINKLASDYAPHSIDCGGYLTRAMVCDENGIKYNQNEVSTAKIAACNDSKFAFVQYPSRYGISAHYTFIVNEKGIIYRADCGNDARKIIVRWPGKDPTTVISPGGEYWERMQELRYPP